MHWALQAPARPEVPVSTPLPRILVGFMGQSLSE